jgi:hypothetical protein
MAIAHLSYVICDSCGTPASQPEDDARTARQMMSSEWTRVNGRDFCPICSVLPTRDTPHPLALAGLENCCDE